MSHSYESHFGPPSDQIDIAQFIEAATVLETRTPASILVFSTSPSSVAGFEEFDQLPEDQKESIASECRYVPSTHVAFA